MPRWGVENVFENKLEHNAIRRWGSYRIMILNGNIFCWKLWLQNPTRVSHCKVFQQPKVSIAIFIVLYLYWCFIYIRSLCVMSLQKISLKLYMESEISSSAADVVLYFHQVLVSISSSSSFSKKLICYLISNRCYTQLNWDEQDGKFVAFFSETWYHHIYEHRHHHDRNNENVFIHLKVTVNSQRFTVQRLKISTVLHVRCRLNVWILNSMREKN